MANAPDSNSNPNKQTPDLVFVNVSDLAGSDSQHVRRLVRSSATRHSHRDPTRKPKARKAARNKDRLNTDAVSASSSRDNSPNQPEETRASAAIDVRNGPLFSLEEKSMVTAQMNNAAPSNERGSHPLSVQVLSQANNAYPVEPEEWFPWVLSHYRTSYLPAGLSYLQLSEQEGADYIDWFMREGLTEPALFYAQLLSACSALVREGRVSEQHVEWLKAKSMQSLNDAVGDATRVSRAAALIAIALAALYEHVHGSRDVAAEVHGRAFSRLLELRGGVQRLDMPRLAWKILFWIDDVVGGKARSDETSRRLTETWISAYEP